MPPERPQVGQQFDPWPSACGFFPPDVIGRLRGLGCGHKLVYMVLVREVGTDGRCWRSPGELAVMLGGSERKIRYSLKLLKNQHLIRQVELRLEHRGLCKGYEFLWHPAFERCGEDEQR